jgi:hypothetical protein
MRSLIQFAVVAAALASPIATLAQSAAPLTRAQVKAELAQLQQAGYSPSRDDPNYPSNIQAAEARLVAQTPNNATDTGYGGTAPQSSAAGTAAAPVVKHDATYFGD